MEIQRQLKDTIMEMIRQLDAFPPLITSFGVQTVRQWLGKNGIDLSLLGDNVDQQQTGSTVPTPVIPLPQAPVE